MTQLKLEKPRGILNMKAGEEKFRLSRYLPSSELEFFIEHYWIVEWDLRGQEPYCSETLPHPSVHLVFEQEQSRVVGVMRGRFSRVLEEQGQVLGIKFKPGSFYPFVQSPISELTNRIVRLSDLLNVDSNALEKQIFSTHDHAHMVQLAEGFIRERLPEQDETIKWVHQMVAGIMTTREIVKVDDVVRRCKIHKRTLQRLFNQYVGVSPKWVIQRYRLHEAAERLAKGEMADWSTLALELGYFDQAHFINDFKTIIGKSPTEYVKKLVRNK